MASDYSPLKIELIKTGEQVATWGQTTNTNLGTAIEQAIGGKADVTMSSTTRTLTLSDTNAAQDARALYLNLTGTPGGAATLNLPAVEKAYIVRNGTTGGFAVTVKVTGQTGVSVPNGATMHLYNNGTDVVNAMTNLPAGATIGGVAIGTGGGSVTSVTGTGTVNGITLTGTVTSSGNLTLGGTLSNVDLTTQVTNTLPTNRGGTGQTVAKYCNLTNATNVDGILPVANGGTGAATLTANAALIGNGTGAVLGLSPGTSGNIMTSNGTTWTSAALPATVSSFSGGTTGLTPSGSTTGAITLGGTLGVANGGTGQTTYTNGQLLIGNTTGNTLAKATLTAGTGISITNGAGSITIAATNNGTVTSVGGTGTVNGISLSGTVTSSGNLSLSGSVSIAGSQVTSGDIAAARITSALNAGGSAPIYACRAWVNFNGTGTVAIREDGNVSSITDNGTGDYTVNFTTAMPDANYVACATSVQRQTSSGANQSVGYYSTDDVNATTYSTTAIRISTKIGSVTGFNDTNIVSVAIFR